MFFQKKVSYFISLILFLAFSNEYVVAEGEVVNDSKKEILAPEKTLVINVPSLEKKGLFYQEDEVSNLKSTLPFYGAPFINFKIDFGQLDQKVLSPGEVFSFDSKIKYADDSKKGTLEKIKKDCLIDQERLGGDEKNCRIPDTYSFPQLKNVSVLAQIWREETDEIVRRSKGDYLVDSFYVLDNVDFIQLEEREMSFRWPIPKNAESGRYYASFFINQNKSFTLFGFPVNVFAPYLRFDFGVEGSEKKGVSIDKNNIKINGTEYSQVLPVPSIEKSDNIIVEIPLNNNSPETQQVILDYKLQRWTQEDSKDLIKDKQEKIILPAGKEQKLSFSFTPEEMDSFLNLEVSAVSENSKSMIDIHFSINNSNRGVIRFLGVGVNDATKLLEPLVCLRNANWSGDFEGVLKLDFMDADGNNINQMEARGLIPSEEGVCFALKNENVSKEMSKKCLKIKGTIKNKDGNISDQKEIFSSCDKPEERETENKNIQKIDSVENRRLIYWIAGFFLMVVSSFFIFIKVKKS